MTQSKEKMMKILLLFCSIFIMSLPATAYAWGLEIAGGAWYQRPTGNISFDKTIVEDNLNLESDLNFDDKWEPIGRLIIDMPLFFPNIYLAYTPIKWDAAGSKSVNFKFGDKEFQADVAFDSELEINQFDVGLFWSLPFINTATADVLNIDLGLDVKLLDVKAAIDQKNLNLSESVSYLLPLPMLYTGIQIKPLKSIALEFEGRGIAYSSSHYISLIGRLKVKPKFFGPVFIAGGYRYDSVKIDYKDLDINTEFSGPFAEAGLAF